MASITGRYQYRLPIALEEPPANPARHRGLPPGHPSLPSLLNSYGPLRSGYDHFWGFRRALAYFTHKSGRALTDTDDLWDGDVKVHETGCLTDLLGSRAISVIESNTREKRPFLLSLNFNAPHWPWERAGRRS